MPLPIKRLEIHASHMCNMTCESCSHFSNNHHPGIVRPDEVMAWSMPWMTRIEPEHFIILGGEPTLNPQLPAFVQAVGICWPRAKIELYTNGWYIHRFDASFGAILGKYEVTVSVSIHSPELAYAEAMDRNVALLREWSREYKFPAVATKSWEDWTRRHHGARGNVMPFRDGNQRASWENCRAKHCKQLFEGKIWKCSPQAYFQLQARKFTVDRNAWSPFLAHPALDPSCTTAELEAFFAAEDEACCGCCPAKPERFLKPLPVRL